MRFAYARRGGPLLDWSGVTPPQQTRAGETRSLGDFYPTTRTSNALRRYGGRGAGHGAAISYEHDRALGYWGSSVGQNGSGYHPPPNMGAVRMNGYDIPRPGAPEVVEGYESPAPGAAIIHLGEGNYMPEGAARAYGQQMLGADAPPKPAAIDMGGLVRKASMVAAAYHGVRRNNGSVVWGLLWAVAAYFAPLHGTLVPAIGVAQGFGQSKVKNNPARSGTARRRAFKRVAARKARKKARTRKYRATRARTKRYARRQPVTKRGY